MMNRSAHRRFRVSSWVCAAILFLLRSYQWLVSPLIGGYYQCRYAPSCSEYACQAFEQHGLLRGLWLTLRRLLRCHPLGGCGHDPLPHHVP